MDSPELNFPNGLRRPSVFTQSFGRFLLDSSDNLQLLGFIQIAGALKDAQITKARKLAADPANAELHALDKFTLEIAMDKIFDDKNYERMLGQMTFCRFIDNFLCYLKEVIAEVVKIHPNIVLKVDDKKSGSPLNDEDSLLRIELEVKKLFFLDFQRIKVFFSNKLEIPISEETLRTLTVFIKERNIIVHNRATVTEELIALEPGLSSFHGKHMQFKYIQLPGIYDFLYETAAQLDGMLIEKYGLTVYGK